MSEAQDVFLTDPKSEEALEARRQLARLTELDEPDTALVKLVKLRKRDEKDGDGLDLAILHLAGRYIEREEYRPGTSLLKEIVDRYPPSSTTSRAMLMLADIHKTKKDQKTSDEWLTRCVEFELAKPSDDLPDPNNEDSLSTSELARRCQENDSHYLAFKLWRAWSWKGGCATGLWAMQRNRNESINECLPYIEDHVFVIQCCLGDATTCRGEYGNGHLVQLYCNAGQLLDLARIADELEVREREYVKERKQRYEDVRTTSKVLRGAIVAETLRKNDDIDGLVRQLSVKECDPDLKQYIAEVLSECGE
jgi:hypothetical protein